MITASQTQMQNLVEEYQEAGEQWPARTREIAAWAIREGKWNAHPSRMIAQCAGDIARAL